MKRLLVLLAVLALSPLAAHATPVSCLPLPAATPDGLKLSDLTFRGANADGCYGVRGDNDKVGGDASEWAVNTVVPGGLWGGGWESYVKYEVGTGTQAEGGFADWNLSVDRAKGTWTLTPSGLVTVDLLAVVKAGHGWASYYFQGEAFDTTGPSAGDFTVGFTKADKGGKKTVTNDLSHFTLYLREAEAPPEVPEPASLVLIGTGLFGLAAVARRRRR